MSSSSTAACCHSPQPRAFAAWLRVLFRHDWVVYSKTPFGGPEHVLRYLGAYTHRVAISNSRLVALSDGNVTFRWRDSAHGNKKRLMTLAVDEFLRRFLLHLLPPGFVRIRNFGFLANRNRATLLPLCFQTARRLREDDCFGSITVHRPDSLTLELPSLRRNHARRRTALRRPTPASLSTATRTARSMKLYPHPRPLPVLRRARRSLVSSGPELLCPQSLQPRLTPQLAASPLHPAIKPAASYPTQSLPDPSAPAQPHSKYIAFHEGGFLQVAVSEAPPSEHATAHRCVAGRSRYSTKTSRY